MFEQNFETIHYLVSGKIKRFKVSKANPRNFKVNEKYIVVGQSLSPQIVLSEKNAKKLNESILTGDKIRKYIE